MLLVVNGLSAMAAMATGVSKDFITSTKTSFKLLSRFRLDVALKLVAKVHFIPTSCMAAKIPFPLKPV